MRLPRLRSTRVPPPINIVRRRSLRWRTVTLDQRHDVTSTCQKQRSSQTRKPTSRNHDPSHITPLWPHRRATLTHPPTPGMPIEPGHADARPLRTTARRPLTLRAGRRWARNGPYGTISVPAVIEDSRRCSASVAGADCPELDERLLRRGGSSRRFSSFGEIIGEIHLQAWHAPWYTPRRVAGNLETYRAKASSGTVNP